MNESLACPQCYSVIGIPDRAEGKKVRCPICNAVFQLPRGKLTSHTGPPVSEEDYDYSPTLEYHDDRQHWFEDQHDAQYQQEELYEGDSYDSSRFGDNANGLPNAAEGGIGRSGQTELTPDHRRPPGGMNTSTVFKGALVVAGGVALIIFVNRPLGITVLIGGVSTIWSGLSGQTAAKPE